MNSLLIIPLFFIVIHFLYIITAISFPRKKKDKDKTYIKNYSIEHIVCFKNESDFIQKKLENCYSINSCHKIHHTFINDNSDDNTLEMLNKYKHENTTIINNDTNLGKNQSQIKAVNSSTSDLILFTDANVFLTNQSVENIVKYFNNEIGGISGNVQITTDFKNVAFSGKYWELEKKIKEFQNQFDTVIGFDGGFYCVKRENYNLTRENELSDFETAFLIFEQGKKTKYAKDAVAIELEKRTIKNSLKTRLRASNRVFCSFCRIFKYINKIGYIAIIHFIFHKIFRYAASIFFVLFFPLFIYEFYKIHILMLLIFIIPVIARLIIESFALVAGGVIALTGKEYVTWTNKKI